jgi:hypothetical protein
MDDNLLGYLLNSLEPDEHRQVEEYLRTHPDAATKLERLRHALAPLSPEAESPAPPRSLLFGTLALIAEAQCRPTLPPAPPVPRSRQRSRDWRWVMRRANILVAASFLFVIAGLGATWIVHVHHEAQRVRCENNLRLWGESLHQYSDNHANHFPTIEQKGPLAIAGSFVPMLNDAGLIAPNLSVGCPAIGLQAPPTYSVRELDQMYKTDPNGFQVVAPSLARDYAYTLGYWSNGRLLGLSSDSGDLLPILADRPPLGPLGHSPNHGGRGQNVLYIGGNVRWCTVRTVGVGEDDIYLSTNGLVEGGQSSTDTVLAPSEAGPTARRCYWQQ